MRLFFYKNPLLVTTLFFAAQSICLAEQSSLEKLMEGNQRYVKSSSICHEDWTVKRAVLKEGQAPFAIIVACSDSRVPPEIIFDQSLGDLFVVRLAGNVVDAMAIGSIEYAVSALKARLIVVLGHEKCGAVDSALKGLKFDNHIQAIIQAIQPAVKATRKDKEDVLEKTIKANIKNTQKALKYSKPFLKKEFYEDRLEIIGAYYHLETGKVELLSNQ